MMQLNILIKINHRLNNINQQNINIKNKNNNNKIKKTKK